MPDELTYPSPEKIISYNVLALMLIRVKKADEPKLLNREKVIEAID